MTLTAPPRLPRSRRTDDPEALIEEARRRARRRRAASAVTALLLLGGGLGAFVAFGGGGGSKRGGLAGTHGRPVTRGEELRQIERAAAQSTIVEAGLVAPGVGWAMNGLDLWWTQDDGRHWRAI